MIPEDMKFSWGSDSKKKSCFRPVEKKLYFLTSFVERKLTISSPIRTPRQKRAIFIIGNNVFDKKFVLALAYSYPEYSEEVLPQ